MIFDFKNYDWKKYNLSLIVVVIVLCVTSAYVVKLAGGAKMGEYYFRHQLIGMMFGLVVAVFVSLLDYHFVCRFAVIYYMFGTFLVAATRIPGIGVDHDTGQYRWLRIGVEFQPSELCKIILVLSLAALFTRLEQSLNKWHVLFIVAFAAAVPTFFVMTQSDLSSSMVMMFIFGILVFSSGISYKILLPVIGILIPLVLGLFWYIQQPGQLLLNKYQQQRVLGFLNQEESELSTMYQQNLSVDAIASGKVSGKIFEKSRDEGRNYDDVMVNESDFIFSVIGEELGFIGSFIIIILFGIIVVKCVLISISACDYLGRLIAMGIGAMLMFQVFANIGVATKLLPNTGLPLPFMSYGLSSMVSCMIGIGFVLNVGLQSTRKIRDGFAMD